MRISFNLLALLVMAAFVGQINAQPPGPGGPGGGRPVPPVMSAIDTDNNGEVSAKEIENASKALATLDKNKDGKLTEDELRPEMGRGGEGRGGPGGPGGRLNADEMLARMDSNKDGKIAKDEIPEQMREFVGRADADKDGTITKEELTKMVEEMRSRFGQGRPGGAGGPGGPGGFGGPPNAEAMVDRMLTFDADKDGKLSKDELLKYSENMREQMGRAFGGGGRDGNRPGGEGRGRDGEGKDRPKRPQ
jgi:Ca2+-binding EF-hand superfamily protein